MGEWDGWIGNEQRHRTVFEAEQAYRWLGTFDRNPAEAISSVKPGVQLPPQGVHFALCQPAIQTEFLDDDGHPRRWDSLQSFLPPISLPRRMWASGAVDFHYPIAIGAPLERISRITRIEERHGRSGELVFVDVEHELHSDDTRCVTELQTLVYREAAGENAPLSPAEPDDGRFSMDGWYAARAIVPDARLLFRYSAITFNTHRIHYDVPYAQNVERYRGLVVHGPLIASLLMQFAASVKRKEQTINHFTFRALSPAIAGEELHLASDMWGRELGAFASDGREVMRAEAIHRSDL